MAVDVQQVELVIAFLHPEGSVIWWLEAFAHCVPADEDMCTGPQSRADVGTGMGM